RPPFVGTPAGTSLPAMVTLSGRSTGSLLTPAAACGPLGGPTWYAPDSLARSMEEMEDMRGPIGAAMPSETDSASANARAVWKRPWGSRLVAFANHASKLGGTEGSM